MYCFNIWCWALANVDNEANFDDQYNQEACLQKRLLVRSPFFCCILVKIAGDMEYSDVFGELSAIFCQMKATLSFSCIHQEAFMHKAAYQEQVFLPLLSAFIRPTISADSLSFIVLRGWL